MPRQNGNLPKTYDQITRETVPDPDSSMRPSRTQEKEAREGHWELDEDEAALRDRVLGAVAGTGAEAVTVEVSRDLVTLSGRVGDPATLRALESAVARVPGVGTIHNQVVVGS